MAARHTAALLLGVLAGACRAQDAQPSVWTQIEEGFKSNVQVLAYGTQNGVESGSPFNPGNRFANISSGDATMEIRPDFRLTFGAFTFVAKPRLTTGTSLLIDVAAARHTPVDAYMQEWAVRANITRSLQVSYGREVLQWGPSMSYSPSNPFFADNGRANPIKEIGARDFFRAVYTPNSRFSLSYLTNTKIGRGDLGPGPFRVIQALKGDFTSRSFNMSANASYTANGRATFGGYFQATLSDAMLAYAETALSDGTAALYPAPANGSGWTLAAQSDRRARAASVFGGAYSLRGGTTLTVEYISNRLGYSGPQAREYFQMVQAAARDFESGGPGTGAGAALLGAALNPDLPLLRRNYLFFQLLRANYRNRADMTIRYTANLDDGGGTWAGYATENLTNHVQLFAVGMLSTGGRDTESRRLLRDQLSVGIRFFVR